jgi:hypothetical protein
MSNRSFRDFSIRAKLLWIVMLTSSIALIAAGVAIVAYDSITFTQQKRKRSRHPGSNSRGDQQCGTRIQRYEGGQGIPAALKARPEVASAVMYDDRPGIRKLPPKTAPEMTLALKSTFHASRPMAIASRVTICFCSGKSNREQGNRHGVCAPISTGARDC